MSVLMPAYNAGKTLRWAIDSIVRQSWQALELIVVNDGSNDNTATVLADCARHDSRIRVVNRANGGIVAALNDGWQECTGDYVARMDADDFSMPWRLALQVGYMQRNPEIAASGTAILPFQAKLPLVGLPAHFPVDDVGIRTRLLFNPPIMHPTAIVRRSVFGTSVPYSTAMPQAEDYELWTRLAATHRLGNIRTLCLLYRRSATSISNSRRDEQMKQADTLRLRNLAHASGQAFASQHAERHLELMRRRHTPASLVASLPDYVTCLLEQPALSKAVVSRFWFSYCIDYTRAGGDGAALFRQVAGVRGGMLQLTQMLWKSLR